MRRYAPIFRIFDVRSPDRSSGKIGASKNEPPRLSPEKLRFLAFQSGP